MREDGPPEIRSKQQTEGERRTMESFMGGSVNCFPKTSNEEGRIGSSARAGDS